MSRNDYAILVGINRYADKTLEELDGPVRDVKLMREWLQSANGGDIADTGANIVSIVSDEQSQSKVRDGEMPPLVEDFLNAFRRIVIDMKGTGYVRRRESRLYLYFSGHGFCEKHNREAHAALYVANADKFFSWNIFGTYFAQWTKDNGLFGEIVLIMDCCRDAQLTKMGLVPPLPKVTDVGTGNSSKLFEVYAAPRGGKAQERPIASRNNEVHGLLTHAFLDAFRHAAPREVRVASNDIKTYLEARWSALCGNDPANPPEVYVPSNGEIYFHRGPAADLEQGFTVNNLSGEFEIFDANLALFMRVTMAGAVARIVRINCDEITRPINDRIIMIPLPFGLYAASVKINGNLIKREFQAGDVNVEF